MSFVFDVHAEPKVVDMTREGSYMGVLGKNGIVKVGALMFLLLCALKFVVFLPSFYFSFWCWTEFSDGLHRKRHSFHIVILRASQVRSLPSWWRQSSANLCFHLSQNLFWITLNWKTTYWCLGIISTGKWGCECPWRTWSLSTRRRQD